MGRGVPFSGGTEPLWTRWFGASPSASPAVNTAAINAAIAEAGASGRDLRVEPGVFQINGSLLFDALSGMDFLGCGYGAFGGTVFDWFGDAATPAFKLVDARENRIGNFQVRTTSASRLLHTGILMQQGIGSQVATNNLFHNILIHGWIGFLGYGVTIEKESGAPDFNNDYHTFDNVYAIQYSDRAGLFPGSCGFRNLQPQAKSITFQRCGFSAHDGSSTTQGSYGYYGHCSLRWHDGGGGSNALADFHITHSNDVGLISGVNIEHSKRFLEGGGVTAVMTVQAPRWETQGVVRDDAIILWDGGLTVEGGRFASVLNTRMQIRANTYRDTHIEVRNTFIESDIHPMDVSLSQGTITYSFIGCVGYQRDAAGNPEGTLPWADMVKLNKGSETTSGTNQKLGGSGGYLRPVAPRIDDVFFDRNLDTLITWNGTNWVAAGAVAGAEWTFADGGTLVGAWHFDSGVTESGGFVSAVTGKFGTSAPLLQATGADQPMLLDETLNGHALIRGTDAADFLEATLGVALTQPCTVYVVGQWGTGGDGTEIFGCSNGNIVGKNITNRAGQFSGVNSGAGANSVDDARRFWEAFHFNDTSSEVRGFPDVGGIMSGPTSPGAGNGNTQFRVGRATGLGQLTAFSLILVYSSVTDAAAIDAACNEWGSVR